MPPESDSQLQFLAAVEKRREPREAAAGRVLMSVCDAALPEFEGHLVDLSASGFRARHSNRELQAGQMVSFHHSHGSGEARVVWNRMENGLVESGFFLIVTR